MAGDTPMMRQYHDIKREHPDALLLFRLGDFYEMFYEDAVVGSRELEITLTSRHNDPSGDPIPMCGVPHHSVNNYLGRLIRKGYKVAICEQVEDPRRTRGLVRRAVTRIVTPGTVIEEGVLDSKENNFIASVCSREQEVAAAFVDVSTGEFVVTRRYGEGAWERIVEEVRHYRPRELVVPESDPGAEAAPNGALRSPQADWVFNPDYATRVLEEHFGVSTLEGFGLNEGDASISAAGALLNYLKETQKSALGHITAIRVSEPAAHLKLDESTVENLELVRGLDGNRQWTLLATLDRTRTGMGGRLLRSWVVRPSVRLEEINSRLEAIEELLGSPSEMSRLGETLEPIQDLERLLSRVTMGTAGARDLVALRESLACLPRLAGRLESYRCPLLRPRLDLMPDLAERLERSIADDPPVAVTEGGLIRSGYSPELDRLREVAGSGRSFIARLESAERERTGIGSLKVKYNKVFGYFIEVTRAHLASVPEDYIRKQTLVGSERFITPELKEYEEKVLTAEERIVELEHELFIQVRTAVAAEATRIRAAAHTVACLDVLLALAEAAHRNRYVRPALDESEELVVRGGRHPVVELQSSEPFVPNDLESDTADRQLMILTGPNMGGKSTYLRQNALIVIMAQMGSFVPAEEARIGLVDRVYTRVGASDNLARGQSTFMVEMIETARILNTVTTRSFILLDEVGRGTATFDGLSIAWSVAEYLLTEESRRARTLFATHYHELTRLESFYNGAYNCCVTVRETEKGIVFFHRVLAGTASKSYGIEVARLAGLPGPVIERARDILSRLERKQLRLSGQPEATEDEVVEEIQKNLF